MGERKQRVTIEGKAGLGATPGAGDGEAARLLARALKDQRKADQAREDAEPALTWLEEAQVLAPCKTAEVAVGEHKVLVRNPKTGVWLAALPHLQKVLDAARSSMGEDAAPMYVLLTLLQSWDAGKVAEAAGESVCAILDLFLGKEPGWVAANSEPQEIVALVAAVIQVLPMEQYRYFFARAAGAWKGHAATAKPGAA